MFFFFFMLLYVDHLVWYSSLIYCLIQLIFWTCSVRPVPRSHHLTLFSAVLGGFIDALLCSQATLLSGESRLGWPAMAAGYGIDHAMFFKITNCCMVMPLPRQDGLSHFAQVLRLSLGLLGMRRKMRNCFLATPPEMGSFKILQDMRWFRQVTATDPFFWRPGHGRLWIAILLQSLLMALAFVCDHRRRRGRSKTWEGVEKWRLLIKR